MRWVDRGPEPEALELIRSRYTRRWVGYYGNNGDPKPSDTRWRDFHDDLSNVFFGNCGYCEETDKGEVDHFRPKSRFPELAYEWTNWVFACHNCNHAKGDKWPGRGYVDPCARSRSARPERFFSFDTTTGEIILKAGLSPARRRKAIQMIGDLGLNDQHHLQKRRAWIELTSKLLSFLQETQPPSVMDYLRRLTSRTSQLSSVTRTLLAERGYPVAD